MNKFLSLAHFIRAETSGDAATHETPMDVLAGTEGGAPDSTVGVLLTDTGYDGLDAVAGSEFADDRIRLGE